MMGIFFLVVDLIYFYFLSSKKRGADYLRDFRPTSLMGSLYKMLVKVFASRLKEMVGKLVSLCQNAFVEGR